jgi:PAS domain S-box-containing protein
MTRRNSIGRQLMSVMMIACTTVVVLTAVLITAAEFLQFRETAHRDLRTLAAIVGDNCSAAITFGDRDSARETLTGLHVTPSVVAAALYDANNTLFAHYEVDGLNEAIPPLGADGVSTTSHRIVVVEPVRLHDGARAGTIVLAGNLDEFISRVCGYMGMMVGIVLLSLGVAWIIARRLQRIVSKPIVALARTVEHIGAQKDYSIRFANPRAADRNEVAELIAGFNTMLGEIESRDANLEDQIASRTSELVAAKETAELILNSAGEGIFGLDGKGRVTFMNPSAAHLLHRGASDFLGLVLHDIIHPEGIEVVPVDQCGVCSSTLGGMRGDQAAFALPDGSSIPVEFTASTMADGVVVTFRDITGRLAIEKMKDEFVATVSHELRTPLTSIRGSLSLLNTSQLGEFDPRARRMLEIAVKNTERLVRLINDILDVEKMSAGRVELNRVSLSASSLIAQTIEAMQPLAEREGVALVAANGSDAEMMADPDRMMQTLTNLVSNAIKFSPRDTTVTVGGRVEGQSFVFTVTDEGRGIPADKLESVFERFKQVNASDSRDKGGTGLGLAICRSIVAAHGGRIWAERREPAGTRFLFTIPLSQAPRVPMEVALAS